MHSTASAICLIGLLLASPAHGELRTISPTVPADQPAATILSEAVIVKQPNRYIGWPTIVTAGNGDLLVVFSGDRDWHVCPWGKVMLVRSTDGGRTWSEPTVVMNTPLDDRDTGLTKLRDGTLILSFNTSVAFDDAKIQRYQPYRQHAASLSEDVRAKWKGAWTMRSNDHGRTWSEPNAAPAATPHGPTALRDDRLLYVRPTVWESSDQAANWSQICRIEQDPQTWKSRYAFLSEQHAVQTAEGRIVALSRYAEKATGDNNLRQMESSDGGRTWTQPVKTDMQGYPAHLLRLENGWLLATYGRRMEPKGERACLSKDNGKTWLAEQEIVLSNAVPQGGGDLGYPSSAQLPDGSIWTVYYQVEKQSDGEYPCLMGTHWQLKQ